MWVNLPYVHTAIYETYLVQWCCIDLWSIGERGWGSVCHGYICILLYMKLLWCSGFLEIYAQLEGVGSVCHDDLGICALYYMCNTFCVVVLHRSIDN